MWFQSLVICRLLRGPERILATAPWTPDAGRGAAPGRVLGQRPAGPRRSRADRADPTEDRLKEHTRGNPFLSGPARSRLPPPAAKPRWPARPSLGRAGGGPCPSQHGPVFGQFGAAASQLPPGAPALCHQSLREGTSVLQPRPGGG